jgi:hypothetical protein
VGGEEVVEQVLDDGLQDGQGTHVARGLVDVGDGARVGLDEGGKIGRGRKSGR